MININESNLVHGEPEKNFFITMLVKDISLKDAIGDLVDNSVDSIKIKSNFSDNLSDYTIDIKFDAQSFSIKDNGLGIEEDIARTNAFKLGKPNNYQTQPNSIGRFGIGMKRAFFKIGEQIHVESVAPRSKFTIDISVPNWKANNNWDFHFTSVDTNLENDDTLTGTNVLVKSLLKDTQENFQKVGFENELIDEIGREHILNIQKGLRIIINGHKLNPRSLEIKMGDDLKPSYWSHIFTHEDSAHRGNPQLKVEIFAGVGEEIEDEGGWNIFCNDRLIVDRDTSDITGWTGSSGDGVAKYHQQFWSFRGYVFFKAEDSTLLPWNTTKTGLDPDSNDFIVVRKKMIELTKDVILLLNRMKKEREKGNPVRSQVLNNNIKSASPVPIQSVVTHKSELSQKFQFPQEINVVKQKEFEKITYEVPISRFNSVKRNLGATTSSVKSL